MMLFWWLMIVMRMMRLSLWSAGWQQGHACEPIICPDCNHLLLWSSYTVIIMHCDHHTLWSSYTVIIIHSDHHTLWSSYTVIIHCDMMRLKTTTSQTTQPQQPKPSTVTFGLPLLGPPPSSHSLPFPPDTLGRIDNGGHSGPTCSKGPTHPAFTLPYIPCHSTHPVSMLGLWNHSPTDKECCRCRGFQ